MNASKGLPYFVRAIVLGFGFFSGLWIAVGVDPEIELIKGLAEWANSTKPGLSVFFWMIPVFSSAASVFLAYTIGGWIGLLAVGFAFVGGLMIIYWTEPAFFFIIIAVILGMIASKRKTKKDTFL